MKKVFFTLLTVLSLMGTTLCGADKLAVAEPIGRGGISASEVEMFWSILETSIHSDEYTLISRAALKQILTEIGLTSSSDLISLNSKQKAKLGEIEGVKYIMISEIGRFGSRLNCTIRVVDATTGEIDQQRTANLRVNNIDELADRIEGTVEKLLSDNKQMQRSALLAVQLNIVKIPDFLEKDFTTQLESTLLQNGVQLQNLQHVKKILQRNNLGRLNAAEPKTYRRVGELLEVKNLIMPEITRFEIVQIPYTVSETGASGVRMVGYLEGSVRVINTARGNVVGSVPFEGSIDFRELPRIETRDWTADDYGKYMTRVIIQQIIVPELLKIKNLK